MERFYTVDTVDHAWGDYFNLLAHGMAHRVDGLLHVERTGPFVPPLSKPFKALVATDAFRRELLGSSLRGIAFKPAVKSHVAILDWHSWDRGAPRPHAYPDNGEPEGYILDGEHCAIAAAQMGDLFEVCLQADAHVEKTKKRGLMSGVALIASSWRGHDLFMAHDVLYVYATERARAWLEPRVGAYLQFNNAATI